MTMPDGSESIKCVSCGGEHPRHLSVVVIPSGLGCGLACMAPEQRDLFGLPDPDDAAIGAHPTPPYLEGWQDKPSRYFTVTMTEPFQNTPALDQEHFRYALNKFGLGNALRAGYSNPDSRIQLDIQGHPVTFAFSTYTATERLQIWVDAITPCETPRLIRGARLSWTSNPAKPQRDWANRTAVTFLKLHAPTDDPVEHPDQPLQNEGLAPPEP